MHPARQSVYAILFLFSACISGLSLFDGAISNFLRSALRTRPAYDRQLERLDLIPRIHPSSFVPSKADDYSRFAIIPRNQPVTVVLLNWKRLSNVKLLVALYSREVPDIKEIVIFNNRADQPLTYEDFRATGCPPDRLTIVNSNANLYFEARYLACANASTSLCLLQDDDYILHPHIISAMLAIESDTDDDSPVVVLPSEEWLRSKYELHLSLESVNIHTTFYWLGFGVLLSRTMAQDFIATMHELNFAEDERKMADNYFSLLTNRLPRLLEAKCVDLDSAGAFTVGVEGGARNWHYMELAFSRLMETSILDRPASPQKAFTTALIETPCLWSPCLFISNIEGFPSVMGEERNVIARSASLREIEQARRTLWHDGWREWMRIWPMSSAVDGDIASAWKSPGYAKTGEYIGLDFFEDITAHESDLVLLVDISMIALLGSCEVAVSTNGVDWDTAQTKPACETTGMTVDSRHGHSSTTIYECSFSIRSTGWRFIRLQLTVDHVSTTQWSVWEMWMRQRSSIRSIEL